jgi:hypothetical protein
MDWNAFWSGLVGTAVPNICVAGLVLYLTARINRSMERHKKDLEQNLVKFSKLHDKRLEAMIVVYHAFCDYLDFLRVALYTPSRGMNLDPMHEFRRTLERQVIYLDAETAKRVSAYQSELLVFWCWAHAELAESGESARKEVQRRLDHEIPGVLPRLREDINRVLDPHHQSVA